MPKYTLTYFDGRGFAEVSRWLFAAAGQPFDDVRLSHDGEREDWKKLKPTTPFGQLPVLDVDGFKLCQSSTIALYLADEFGFAGKNKLERARIHMICDCLSDVAKNIFPILITQDASKKTELKEKFEVELKTAFENFEKFVTANGDTGYFVGDKATLADYSFSVNVDRLKDIQLESHLDNFPKLKQLDENVRADPKIAEWIAKRPVSYF